MRDNLILDTDSYKFSHHLQYPPNTTQIMSYIESRGGAEYWLVMFGLQAFLKSKWVDKAVLHGDIDEARELATSHGLPFNNVGWKQIRELGYLPVEVRALPEGTVAKSGVPLLTIRNTDPRFPWLPCFLETSLLRAIWYPTTVATISWRIRKLIQHYLEETGDPSLIDFKLHDFGSRGVSSYESAMLGGMAHLVNFKGTDTVPAIVGARRYYHEPMAGFSIPAAEHSTITSWGREHEADAFKNMVQQFGKPGSTYAVVSDSYDLFNAVEKLWGNNLKQGVLEHGGTLVVRPDSGNPPLVVLQCVKMLYKAFGGTTNAKGYIVLNPAVRVIQGDGINEQSIKQILEVLMVNGFSADNVAFGMGGALLQHMNRDTYQFAMKACAAEINGKWIEVYKDPITAAGSKTSKRGLISTIDSPEGLKPVTYSRWSDYEQGQHVTAMKTVFKDGQLLVDETFTTIRGRAQNG